MKKCKVFLIQKTHFIIQSSKPCFKKAKGEFIGFIDADDMWQKNKNKKPNRFF